MALAPRPVSGLTSEALARLSTAAFPCEAQWREAVVDSITVAGAASDWITDFPFTLAFLAGPDASAGEADWRVT